MDFTKKMPRNATNRKWWQWIVFPIAAIVLLIAIKMLWAGLTDNLASRIAKAEKLYENNEIGDALAGFKKASELNLKDQRVLCGLAKCYVKMKNFDEAVPLLQESIRVEKNYLGQYLILSDIYQQLQDYSTAQTYITQAIAIFPDQPQLYIRSGFLFHLMKDYESALGMYDKALSLSPNNLDATNGIRLEKEMIENRDAIDRTHENDPGGFDYEPEQIDVIPDYTPTPRSEPKTDENK